MPTQAEQSEESATATIPPPPVSSRRPTDDHLPHQLPPSVVPHQLDRPTSTADSADRLQQLRQQLVQAERLATLGRTVASVVHELGNPLTNILAATTWLEHRARDAGWDEESRLRLARIAESAELMRQFCRDLGDYTRHTPDRVEPVNIDNLIERALVLCEHEIQAAHVRVAHTPLPLPLQLPAKPRQLVQVFVNLFSNAAQAMQERGGGCLRIDSTADRNGRLLAIRIADEGVGIPPGDESRIFDPFVTTKAGRHGMGLGLSIVREIVADHRGTILVTSEQDVGSVFTLKLPL